MIPNHPEFPNKWATKLPTGWWDSVDSMSKEEIEMGIIMCEKSRSSSEKEKDEDEKLQLLKEDYTLYRSGYTEIINEQKAKIQFFLHVMNERGYA